MGDFAGRAPLGPGSLWEIAMDRTGPPATRVAAITFLMGLAQLITTSDFSLVSVALPTIGRDLGIAPAQLSWVVSANTILFAGFLIVGGRLTDAIGHRRSLGLGLLLFAVGALIAGLSAGVPMLIAARALQGLAGAFVWPASFSLINAFLPEGYARHRALGVFAVMQGLSVIIGLVLGGLLTTAIGWRAVFFLHLPIVAGCLALTAAVLPRAPPSPKRRTAGGVRSTVLIAVATGLLLSALSELGGHGLGSSLGLSLLGGAIAAWLGVAVMESRERAPLVPLGLFAAPRLLGGGASVMALIAAFGGLFVLLSLYLQDGLRISAAATGIRMIPIALATMAAGPCVPALMKRWPQFSVAGAGLVLEIAALLILGVAAPAGDYLTAVAPLIFLAVFGSTTAFMALMSLALSQVPAEDQGAASGLLFTGRQIGMSAGVAIALAVLQAFPAASPEHALSAYGQAFLAPAALAVLALLALVTLARSPALRAQPAGLLGGRST